MASALRKVAAAFKRGEPHAAYYIYGPEDVLKDDAIRYILDLALDPAMRDFNLDQVSAGTLDPEAVEALCTTLPMMAARRVVVIRDVEQWKRRTRGRSAVLRYLEHPSPESVLILVQGAGEEKPDKDLLKHAEPIACAMESAADARRWLDRKTAERGLVFEDGAVDHLMTVTGTSLSAINIELEKLASLPAGAAITVKQVEDLVGVRHGETPLDWRAAILEDDPARALELLPNVLSQSGVSGVRLVSLIGTTFIGVGIVRAAYDKGQRGKPLSDAAFAALSAGRPGGLGPWGPEASLWATWSARWPASRIRVALDAALLADRSLKNTGLSSEQAILSDMIMRIAQGAPAPAGAA
ncbi:MAG TPA: DNA polymerase III subunit delta [Gemmatimonadales bacterium]|jgi:DNA polymerase-3 subunit delta|nr:DNA polymerase III subunit delta [Gemmatimonadales bacterium]